jgi:serine/threonine protein kinase
MEFCDHGSIRDIMHLREEVLTEEQIAIALSDVIKGVQIIHDRHHILHCDIKAANIMLTQGGTLGSVTSVCLAGSTQALRKQ